MFTARLTSYLFKDSILFSSSPIFLPSAFYYTYDSSRFISFAAIVAAMLCSPSIFLRLESSSRFMSSNTVYVRRGSTLSLISSTSLRVGFSRSISASLRYWSTYAFFSFHCSVFKSSTSSSMNLSLSLSLLSLNRQSALLSSFCSLFLTMSLSYLRFKMSLLMLLTILEKSNHFLSLMKFFNVVLRSIS